MEANLESVLGAEEAMILKALRVFPGDVETIHFMTGIPSDCIKTKIAALVALGYVAKGEKWYEATSKGAVARVEGGLPRAMDGKHIRVSCPRCYKVGVITAQKDVIDAGLLVQPDSMIRVHVFPGDVCEHEFDFTLDATYKAR